jgi:hypothetical protein
MGFKERDQGKEIFSGKQRRKTNLLAVFSNPIDY